MMRLITLIVLIISLISNSSYEQSVPKTAEENYKEQADKFYKEGKYEQAKANYNKEKQLPGHETDDYLIAQLENCERCIEFLKTIEELSKDPNSLRSIVVIYEKILDINPQDSAIQQTLVNNYWLSARQRYHQFDFQKAAELFKKVTDYTDSPFIQDAKMLMDSSNYFQNSMVTGFIAPHVDSVATYVTGLKGIVSVISSNMKYPDKAVEKKVSGKVWVSFVITEKGKIIPEMVKVAKGIGSGCDEEAVRLVKLMNNWRPAYKWGKPVRFQTTIPITFSL